jgi:type II secretory pathway pseudopilin PulG
VLIAVESSSRATGFALMEPMIAIGLLAIVASSTLFALVTSNHFAVTQRYVSNAKALCQERIDEALVRPFTSTTVPSFLGTWPLPTTETETQTEGDVPIYTMSDSGQTKLVAGIRHTWVKRYTPIASDPDFVYARVRVKVEFWVNGRGVDNKPQTATNGYFYEMSTLRAPD